MSLGVRDAVLIVNRRAGGGRRMHQLDQARTILRAAGIETELQRTAAPHDATALALRAVQQSRQLVIVCGGDGTVNEAVNGLARSPVPLAVWPAGTANVLAKELGIPWNLEGAARQLAGAEFHRIALGLAVPEKSSGDPRYFLSVAGAGIDAAMVAGVTLGHKNRAGILAYWGEGFRQLVHYAFPVFRATASNRAVDATLLVIGRTRHYGGPFQITTQASLLRPEFELAAITTRSRCRYLGYAALLWAGQLRGARYAEFWKADSLHCSCADGESVLIQVDGEPAGRLPADFRIVPDALTLAMPNSTHNPM